MNIAANDMLEDVIKQFFDNKNIGHAYLFHTKDVTSALSIAKKIYHTFDEDDNLPENIDELINNNVYPDLKIIESDGQWIKKEQIIELQHAYSTKSIYNNKRIYIIKNAENLNSSSANTLLKFLEEPTNDIIAFLLTENVYKIIETIVSRCQYIALESNVTEERITNDKSIKIALLLENRRAKAIAYIMDLLDNNLDKKELTEILSDLAYIYYVGQSNVINSEYEIVEQLKELIDTMKNNNDTKSLNKKMLAIIETIDALGYNINLRLLLDKLIISMFGVE